jgi:Tol biopolymer transport system component
VVAGGPLAQAGEPVAAAPTQAPAADTMAPGADATAPLTNTFSFLPLMNVCRLQAVEVSGPGEGTIGLEYSFMASALGAGVSETLTYTWQATGKAPMVHLAGVTDVVTYHWSLAGGKAITVEVEKACGRAAAGSQIDVTSRGLVAFERHYGEYDPHDIWVTYPNGGAAEFNLTGTPDSDEGAPTWSPDGYFVAYSAGTLNGDDRSIYKMDLRTRGVTRLTDDSYNDRWPAWSPLGDQIAFMRDSGANGYDEIWIMNPDGSGQQFLTGTDRGGSEFPAWSWDGQYIAFISSRHWAGRDLYTMRPDGSEVFRVTPTDRPGGDDRRDEIYPSWSPDGWIYYTYRYRDYPADKTEYLYRIRPDGSETTQVFGDSYDRYVASFAPDGNCFVYYSYLGGGDKEVWKWCNGFVTSLNLTNNDAGDELSNWSQVP